jgi:hypothetical protein
VAILLESDLLDLLRVSGDDINVDLGETDCEAENQNELTVLVAC